jgi:hypothetical protein
MDSLNKEQQQVATAALSGKSICICAPAGVGKSYILKYLLEEFSKLGYETLPCAFTGAASSIYDNGTTVHSASYLSTGSAYVLPEGVRSEPLSWQGIKRRSIETCASHADPRWAAPKLVCVIDEFYQLSAEDARLWWAVGTYIRRIKNLPPAIFIFAGDIGQFLPPSGSLAFETAKFSYYDKEGRIQSIELPSILDEIKPEYHYLTQNMRQRDAKAQKALEWLYYGVAVHPHLIERLHASPPDNTPTYYYNRSRVAEENLRTLEPYLGNEKRIYKAMSENLTASEINYLLPIEVDTPVYLSCPFTITTNCRDSKGALIVANGDVVTVTALNKDSVLADTIDGRTVTLSSVKHHMPYDSKLKRQKTFYQLPGYAGKARSLYKMQGSTLTSPSKFAVWQVYRNGRVRDLGNIPGALYVICSRPTSLDLLYFDRSLDNDELTLNYLKRSLNVDSRVLQFILHGRQPWWYSDKCNVIETISEIEIDLDNCFGLEFLHTNLTTGAETNFGVCYSQAASGYARYVAVTSTAFAVFEPALERLANNWLYNKSI